MGAFIYSKVCVIFTQNFLQCSSYISHIVVYLTQKTVVVLRKHDLILKHFAFPKHD